MEASTTSSTKTSTTGTNATKGAPTAWMGFVALGAADLAVLEKARRIRGLADDEHQRLLRVLKIRPHCVHDPIFDGLSDKQAEQVIFAPAAAVPAPPPLRLVDLDEGKPFRIMPLSGHTPACLSAKEEALLFMAYHFARCRSVELRRLAAQGDVPVRLAWARQVLAWHAKEQRYKCAIFAHNFRLVGATIGRMRLLRDLDEANSHALYGLLRAIGDFNHVKAGRFWFHAIRRIRRQIGRWLDHDKGLALPLYEDIAAGAARGRRRPLPFEATHAARPDSECDVNRRELIRDIRELFNSRRAGLTGRERNVLKMIYGLGGARIRKAPGYGEQLNCIEVGRRIGRHELTVNAIRNKALAKLRAAFAGHGELMEAVA